VRVPPGPLLAQILGVSLLLQFWAGPAGAYEVMVDSAAFESAISCKLGGMALLCDQMVTSYLRAALLIRLEARWIPNELGFFEHVLSCPLLSSNSDERRPLMR